MSLRSRCIAHLCGVAMCVGGTVRCGAATLSTSDGATYAGDVTLRGGDIVEIIDAKTGHQRVPLSRIAVLNMGRAPVRPDPKIAAYQEREDPNLPTVVLREILPATMPSTRPLPLDGGWATSDIGKVLLAGSGAVDSSTITVSGSGWGFWGEEDSGHFVYRPISGDFDCRVHLKTLPAENAPFTEALIVRQDLSADSPMAALAARPSDSPRITSRPLALHDKHAAATSKEPYTWLRLIRCAGGVSGLCSRDGITWVSAGWVEVAMGTDVVVGVGCAAIANQEVDTATFDHFSLTTGMYGPAKGILLTDGTRLPVELRQFDGKSAVYGNPNQPEQSLPGDALAAILRQPFPVPIAAVTSSDTSRLYLSTGDVIDTSGEGSGITVQDGRINVTSVLFGLQSLSMDQIDLALIVPAHPKETIRVSTRAGALYYCKSVSTADGSVSLTTSLGRVKVDAQDLIEMRTIADAVFVQK